MCQTDLSLSQEDLLVIEEIRTKGLHQAREVNRAHDLHFDVFLQSFKQGRPAA